jgi:hypothetical protein
MILAVNLRLIARPTKATANFLNGLLRKQETETKTGVRAPRITTYHLDTAGQFQYLVDQG